MSVISRIFEFHKLAVSEVRRYPKRRFIFNDIESSKGRHFVGITGLRGTGKSIILKQIAALHSDSVYISVDSIGDVDLFELIQELNQDYKIRLFLLDEVHFVKNIDEILKKTYDFFDIRVIFTSSVSLGMFKSAYDLSRRVKLLKIFPFSFREYLYFLEETELTSLTIEQMMKKEWSPQHLQYSRRFHKYLKGGNQPFSMEEPDVLPLLQNILQTIIYKDIPKIAGLTAEELDLIAKTVSFIGKSGVDGINYSSISKNIGITKFKAQSYIELLQKAFVLHRVLPTGSNVLKEPKVLLAPPFRLIFKEYNESIGALREDFFVEMLTMAGFKYHYLKSTRGAKTPDFMVYDNETRYIVEVGGKGKGREQFKGITEKKKIIFSHSDRIDGIRCPLFLAGFL
jgi:predicted AAA+ superfamily ATPase